MHAPDHSHRIERIFSNISEIRNIVTANPSSTPVPSCPDWDLSGLLKHTADICQFWSDVIDARGEKPAPGEPATPRLETLQRLDTEAARLRHNFDDLPTDTPIWTWSGTHSIGPWLARRLSSETALHLWDAQLAALPAPPPIPVNIALDAIDEYFETITFTGAPSDTVHLHASDTEGEWVITPGPDGKRIVTHTHEKAAVAVQANASDLLLLLWGRMPVENLETFGDRSILETWLRPV